MYRVLVGKLEGRRPLGRPRYRWTGHVARMGEERGLYRVLVGKLKGSRPLGRPRYRWVGHVACMVEERGFIGSWWGNWREEDNGET